MIKAIDTKYKGYKFRSRLEARVAVFLDALDSSWEYEPEGYALPVNGNYLPDFLVYSFPKATQPFWLEVKAKEPSKQEVHKLRELCVETEIPGMFFIGSRGSARSPINTFSDIAQHCVEYAGYHVDAFGYPQAALDTYIDDNSRPENFWDIYGDQIHDFWSMYFNIQDCRYLQKAAEAALSARFEFGESG